MNQEQKKGKRGGWKKGPGGKYEENRYGEGKGGFE